MPEPADSLLALAEHFDFRASTEQHGDRAISVWRQAAEEARSRARSVPGAASESGAVSPDAGAGRIGLSAARERLGRLVREVWVDWAHEQYRAKPSWLVPWGQLDAGQREVDMRIGEAVATDERERIFSHEHEWTPCRDQPNCSFLKDPPQPCSCSGIPCCELERREIAAAADAGYEARARERERIRQLARDTAATVTVAATGAQAWFADLIGKQP